MKKQYNIVVSIFIIIALLWLGYTPNVPVQTLMEKYSNEASGFVSNPQGLTVHYRDQGPRDGKTILLLHGNSNSLHAFELLAVNLSTDYRVVSLDFPGHGLTGAHPSNQYGYQQYSDALALVVAHLSLDNFALLGHSMGGWVAWRYAVEHPDQLNALLLVAASGMPARQTDEPRDIGLGLKLLQSPIGPLLSAYTVPRATIQKSLITSVVNPQLISDQLIDQYWELIRHPQNRAALAHRAHASRELSKSDLAKQIELPTLLLWGDKDTFVPPSAAMSFAERIPNTTTVLLTDIGHTPILEAPEETERVIRDFLQRH